MSDVAENLSIRELAREQREIVFPILEGSFEGWYLWHSKRTLREVETVRVALIDSNTTVGVAMLKMLDAKNGYVYYIAVSPEYRRKGIAGRLLDDSLKLFAERGAQTVLAGISEDNAESKGLFTSRGFREKSFAELSKKYGRIHALNLYRKMVIVSGEVVYAKELSGSLDSWNPAG
ncbi:MAG TPA: GNAT family N-acetyltransferase [Nitrososphaerales archaeon]|nr:GNAT family N-acetyltransferase [Nitrososphaerales archaeon]